MTRGQKGGETERYEARRCGPNRGWLVWDRVKSHAETAGGYTMQRATAMAKRFNERDQRKRADMANMSYCRFQNTKGDLDDCLDNLEETVSADEHGARIRIYEMAKEIVHRVDSDYDGDPDNLPCSDTRVGG